VPHTLLSVGSVSLCPLLASKFYPRSISTSQFTVLLIVCHNAHCWLLSSVHRLSVPLAAPPVFASLSVYCPLRYSLYCLSVLNTVPFASSVSVCAQLTFTVCSLPLGTSHGTVGWFCITMPTSVFYRLSSFCQYLICYRPLLLCHYIHSSRLDFFHFVPVPHTVTSVSSGSLRPLIFSAFCPLSVSNFHVPSFVLWHHIHFHFL
jgi:hypothetical protein